MGTFAGASATLPCQDCVTLDYGKQLQIELLKPMLKISTAEKIKYIQSFGIDVMRVQDPSKDPVRLAFLPEANAQSTPRLLKYLKEFEDNAVGLFLTSENLSYGVAKPTILVVESADDWTLIHEFTHFLFERARLIKKPIDEARAVNNMSDAKEDFYDSWDTFRGLGKYRDPQHKVQTLNTFLAFSSAQQQFLMTFELEEIVIEKLIRGFYVRHKLVNVSPAEFERSTRYMQRNADKALANLRAMNNSCEEIKASLGPEDGALLAPVTKVCDGVTDLQRTTEKLKASTLRK